MEALKRLPSTEYAGRDESFAIHSGKACTLDRDSCEVVGALASKAVHLVTTHGLTPFTAVDIVVSQTGYPDFQEVLGAVRSELTAKEATE